jgi:acetate kinase
MAETTILVLNSGSSSLKFGLFAAPGGDPRALCSGEFEEIASDHAHFWIRGATGDVLRQQSQKVPDQETALAIAAAALEGLPLPAPQAAGHRVVHGGPRVVEHQEITPEVLKELEAAAIFAPLHVPAAVKIIRQARRLFPHIPQFACLDTAFHCTLPEKASRFALPEMFWEAGVRRYGFHGLSCESVLHALGTDVPQRVIVVHLGSGASITAIANGSSVDTTMGLTPTGGIVMSTRPGDLDPGALLYLLRMLGGNAAKLEALLDKESGLLGVSGLSGDMRQLHQAADNPRAQCAIEIFCRSAAKAVGAFVTILGGLDLLIFTGGIGEHDAKVREKICAALEPLGVTVDPQSNQSNLRRISAINSRVPAFVLPSDENTQIARHVYRLLLSRAVGGEGA